jgi:predicted secreted hydrolase
MFRILRGVRPLLLSLLVLPLLAGGFVYREALPGYRYQFPRDHFEHQDFRTEWWYYTGNVRDAKGKRFGFELTFFREGERHETENRSAWAMQDLYLAHAALTDVSGNHFWYEERLNRRGPEWNGTGLAGASFDKQRIWNGNWSLQWNGERQTIDAIAGHFSFHLELRPSKPLVIQGENGVSRKAEGRGRASHYISFPRLEVAGTINSSGVNGSAWMDHEWFTEQLSPDQAGWDWSSVQFDNQSELMLYQLRRKDGSGSTNIDPFSSGTFVDAQGRARHLRRGEFTLDALSKWHEYPIEWRIRVPSLGIDLICKAVRPNQELRGRTNYWEGAVDYSGTHRGVGYLEMTGYDRPVQFH